MPTLLVVGGGLFGSLAAAWARRHGIAARVFDAGLDGAASPAAAGLFTSAWIGRKFQEHYRQALPVLEQLTEVRSVRLMHDDGRHEQLLCVPPGAVLERDPLRQRVTAVGDGWLEAGGVREHGWVYVAAGVWCDALVPVPGIHGKAGTALAFPGEHPGRIRPLASGRQAIAFVRDAGQTYFSDGTAERDYTPEHERQTHERALAMGLLGKPIQRWWGQRPYVPGGPVFRRVAARTWLAAGGRKLGTILGAAFARRLVEELRR